MIKCRTMMDKEGKEMKNGLLSQEKGFESCNASLPLEWIPCRLFGRPD